MRDALAWDRANSLGLLLAPPLGWLVVAGGGQPLLYLPSVLIPAARFLKDAAALSQRAAPTGVISPASMIWMSAISARPRRFRSLRPASMPCARTR